MIWRVPLGPAELPPGHSGVRHPLARPPPGPQRPARRRRPLHAV